MSKKKKAKQEAEKAAAAASGNLRKDWDEGKIFNYRVQYRQTIKPCFFVIRILFFGDIC